MFTEGPPSPSRQPFRVHVATCSLQLLEGGLGLAVGPSASTAGPFPLGGGGAMPYLSGSTRAGWNWAEALEPEISDGSGPLLGLGDEGRHRGQEPARVALVVKATS